MPKYIAVAKFYVESVEKRGYSHEDKPVVYQIVVKLNAVMPNSNDPNNENQKFFKASPGGRFEITIDNPALFDAFNVGEQVYLPMIRASETDLAAVSAAMQSLE